MYSFGVVLMELLTGRPAVDETHEGDRRTSSSSIGLEGMDQMYLPLSFLRTAMDSNLSQVGRVHSGQQHPHGGGAREALHIFASERRVPAWASR